MFSSSFYLGIEPFGDALTLLGIGTIIVAVVSIGTLIFTIRQNKNVNYLEFIKNTDSEFTTQLEGELKLENKEQCIVHAYNYIDLCDRLMFLIGKGKVPKDFFDYYLDYFNYAVTMMWGYAKIYPEDQHSLKTSWCSLKVWITQKDELNPYPLMHLPLVMKKILQDMNIDINQNTIKKDIKQIMNSN